MTAISREVMGKKLVREGKKLERERTCNDG